MIYPRKTALSELKTWSEKETEVSQVSSQKNPVTHDGTLHYIAEILHRLSRHRMLLLSSYNTTGIEDATNAALIKIAEQPCRASDLAQIAFCDPSTIARQVKQLIAENLIKRVPDIRDGRATILIATPLGIERAKKIVTFRNDYYAEVFSTWDKEDRQKFIDYLMQFVLDTERVTEDYFS